MIKTAPKWSVWKNSNNVDTCPSRVATQKGDGVEKSTPNPEVELINSSIEQFTNDLLNIDTSSDLISKNTNRKKSIIKNRVSPSKIPNHRLDENAYDVERHLAHGWELNYGQKIEGNRDSAGSSFRYRKLKNRKLSSTLSLLFGKIAEERMGDKVEGSDKWDIEKIMFRRISKKVITDCKYTREKKQLVLMLDSSPSCRRMAKTYSTIATESARFDDVEIYDAPNGYAHSVYDPRENNFRLLERQELDYTYLWNGFNNRTIIYFGDTDATRSIRSAYKHNDIHWFYQRSSSHHFTRQENKEYLEQQVIKYWGNMATIYNCNNVNELLRAVRDMR
jgi:hypothetical protein